MQNNSKNLEINNTNVVTELQVSYKRKNHIYLKN